MVIFKKRRPAVPSVDTVPGTSREEVLRRIVSRISTSGNGNFILRHPVSVHIDDVGGPDQVTLRSVRLGALRSDGLSFEFGPGQAGYNSDLLDVGELLKIENEMDHGEKK